MKRVYFHLILTDLRRVWQYVPLLDSTLMNIVAVAR